jgi:hypothetical protein
MLAGGFGTVSLAIATRIVRNSDEVEITRCYNCITPIETGQVVRSASDLGVPVALGDDD